MPVARPESCNARVIAHVDMDCFYVQVEQRRQPELRGQPAAVVQYNAWKGGGLIAVGYEARKFGVKRSMRGSEVVAVLSRRGRCERASIDEVYLDLTDAAETMLAESPPESFGQLEEEASKSHILGLKDDGGDDKERVREWLCENKGDHRDKLLACGAIIVAELRRLVLKETEFTCSAGVAHNKMLAKLASGMNKPAQQTVVPRSSVKDLLGSLPIKKMKQLGGKLGDSLQSDLGVKTVGDLLHYSEGKLQERYGANTGTWLWNIARGNSGEEVQGRLLPKSHGSGKTFPGRQSLKTLASVRRWLNDLCEELSERLQLDLDKNKRIAHTLTLHANAYNLSETDSHKNFPSRSCPLRYGTIKIQEDSFNLFQAALREYLGAYPVTSEGNQENKWGITGLSVSASKIVTIPTGTCTIKKYFQGQSPSCLSGMEAYNCTEDQDSDLGHLKDLKEGTSLEKTRTESALCDWNSQEQKRLSQGTSTIKKYFEDQDPIGSSHLEATDWSEGKASLAVSGKGSDLGTQSKGLKEETSFEKTITMTARCHMDRQEQKRKSQPGTSSILKFFQHSSSSQSPQSGRGTDHDFQASSARDELQRSDISDGMSNCSRVREPKKESWDYKIDEVDLAIVDELPPEIQDELRLWLHPQKRQMASSGRANGPKSTSAAKPCPSIANYFLPLKKQKD
uniref:DNA polymerase eta n=1 Tax=Kalanchoe fedtschenkoi TaxID=63787 RepID=A0A7N0T572_KALFE